MHPSALLRIAHAIAAITTRALSLIRPISMYSDNDRDVYIHPNAGGPWWRLDIWLDHDDDPTGCVHIDVLGHHIEVFYMRKGYPIPAQP